jgi:TPR repeat protein
LKLSAEHESTDRQFVVAWKAENCIGAFSSIDFDAAVQNYEQCSDLSPAGSSPLESCLQTGLGISINFTVVDEFLKKAVDLNDTDDLNSFGSCLEQDQGIDADIELAVGYYRKAAFRCHSERIYNFGQCLEYGKGIDEDLLRAVKSHRLSAELKNAASDNSFCVFLERGIEIHKKLSLAGQYYQGSVHQRHQDDASDFIGGSKSSYNPSSCHG